jgi:hypothetical protein
MIAAADQASAPAAVVDDEAKRGEVIGHPDSNRKPNQRAAPPRSFGTDSANK